MPLRRKRGRNGKRQKCDLLLFIQVFLWVLTSSDHTHWITYFIWFLPNGFLNQKGPLVEWTQTIRQRKVVSTADWGNVASFCNTAAVLLENDFRIFPTAFQPSAYAFINMSNCVMEVNDSVGFRNCCLEITLT